MRKRGLQSILSVSGREAVEILRMTAGERKTHSKTRVEGRLRNHELHPERACRYSRFGRKSKSKQRAQTPHSTLVPGQDPPSSWNHPLPALEVSSWTNISSPATGRLRITARDASSHSMRGLPVRASQCPPMTRCLSNPHQARDGGNVLQRHPVNPVRIA